MKRFKVAAVIGARPQFIKAAAIEHAWKGSPYRKKLQIVWLHTGQHYDYRMSKVFFKELRLPEPRYNLRVGSLSHAAQTGKMLAGIESIFQKEKPAMALVFGDTNSTLAGALAAAKMQIPVAHVEAGLRSANRAMPEEVNRIATDHASQLLFCPTEDAKRLLAREGVKKGVHVSGDVMADILRAGSKRLKRPDRRPYYLATIHRNTNTDDPSRLGRIFSALAGLDHLVLMPLHPRTAKLAKKSAAVRRCLSSAKNLRLLPPQPYFKMLALEKFSKGVITDSGGVQKEAFWLGVPCVTLRRETEWKETLRAGMNTLCEPSAPVILKAFKRMRRQAAAHLPKQGASLAILRTIDGYLRKAA